MARGQVFIVVLILVTVAAVLNVAFFNYVADEIKSSSRQIRETSVLNLAEAGIDKALYELSKNSSWSTSGEIFLGGGSFEVVATSTGALSNQKAIESIGYVPNKTGAIYKKKIRAIIYVSGEKSEFYYATQSGNGGIELEQSAKIWGNAYTNGSILCASNMSSQITGDAFASSTIDEDCNIGGARVENATPTPMPPFDEAFWQSEAAKGDVYEGDLILSGGSYGPKKINGNLTIDGNVTITGPLYITGSFTINSNSNLYLHSSFNSNGTVILMDGSVTVNSNTVIHPTSATPKGYIQIVNSSSTAGITLNANSSSSIIYSLNNDVRIRGSAKAVSLSAGRKLILENSSDVRYDTGVQSIYFTSGPGGGWMVKRGTWRVIKEN